MDVSGQLVAAHKHQTLSELVDRWVIRKSKIETVNRLVRVIEEVQLAIEPRTQKTLEGILTIILSEQGDIATSP